MIDKFHLQTLIDLPIEGVAGRLGLHVSHHRCLCPFHEDKHPSLTFDTRRNRYRCFVCGEHGRTIDLVMKQQHLRFPDACRWLADGTNVIVETYKPSAPISDDAKGTSFDARRYLRFFEHPRLSEAACRFLYEERRLDPRVVRWCRITSWRDKHGNDWLQTPYYDVEGQLIGVQNRNLDGPSRPPLKGGDLTEKCLLKGGEIKGLPRFRFPYGSRCSIYNLPILKMLKPGEPLFITEGCSDCWAMLSAGHKAIAIPSATLLKPNDLLLLESWASKLGTTFHMFPDQDEPGERLFLQLRDHLASHYGGNGAGLQRHQLPIGCKDFSEYYIQQKR